MVATCATETILDPALLTLLRCPVSHQPLQLLAPEEALCLGLPAQPVLMRADGRLYYRFEEHGFPLLLPGSGIDVTDAVVPAAFD